MADAGMSNTDQGLGGLPQPLFVWVKAYRTMPCRGRWTWRRTKWKRRRQRAQNAFQRSSGISGAFGTAAGMGAGYVLPGLEANVVNLDEYLMMLPPQIQQQVGSFYSGTGSAQRANAMRGGGFGGPYGGGPYSYGGASGSNPYANINPSHRYSGMDPKSLARRQSF